MKKSAKIKLTLLCIFFILVQGCATAKKKDSIFNGNGPAPGLGNPTPPPIAETMGPPEAYGPPVPSPTPAMPSFGPEERVQLKPLVLVFGPGLARGYSFVGVLRAFKEQKIQVSAVLGTEMGALMAALYGMSSNLNEFEWGLLKLAGEDNFLPSKRFFSKNFNQVSDGEKFQSALRQIFGKKNLDQTKIPTKIAIQAKATGIPIILDKGDTVLALRAALAAPSLFTPGVWKTQAGDLEAVSASSSRPYLVNEAKSLGLGPVVVIDVLSPSEDAIALSELSAADLVIRPDLTGINYLEFQKKTEAAFRGKNAVLQNLPALKKLVGVTE